MKRLPLLEGIQFARNDRGHSTITGNLGTRRFPRHCSFQGVYGAVHSCVVRPSQVDSSPRNCSNQRHIPSSCKFTASAIARLVLMNPRILRTSMLSLRFQHYPELSPSRFLAFFNKSTEPLYHHLKEPLGVSSNDAAPGNLLLLRDVF